MIWKNVLWRAHITIKWLFCSWDGLKGCIKKWKIENSFMIIGQSHRHCEKVLPACMQPASSTFALQTSPLPLVQLKWDIHCMLGGGSKSCSLYLLPPILGVQSEPIWFTQRVLFFPCKGRNLKSAHTGTPKVTLLLLVILFPVSKTSPWSFEGRFDCHGIWMPITPAFSTPSSADPAHEAATAFGEIFVAATGEMSAYMHLLVIPLYLSSGEMWSVVPSILQATLYPFLMILKDTKWLSFVFVSCICLPQNA